MVKEHKNAIFTLLRNSDLDFNSFNIKQIEDGDLETHVISYRDTPFEFILRQSDESFDQFDYRYTLFAPNYPESNFFPEQGFTFIEDVLESIYNWTKLIKRYLDDSSEIDLWAEFSKGQDSLSFKYIEFDQREEFTPSEKVQVTMAINEFRNLVITNFEATDEELKIINDRLDYLIEAVGRANKFDWRGIAVSTIISISIALSLDTSKGELLWSLFKKVFSAIKLLIP